MDTRTRTALLALAAVAALAAALLGPIRRRRDGGHAPEVPGERVVAERELDGLTRDELYERARAIDLPGRSRMKKAELLRALADAGSVR